MAFNKRLTNRKQLTSAQCLAVVGLQWGDEGKGKIIDWIAADAQHVARFQGGHNAGHTVVTDNREIALHLIPSGILHQQCHCYIGQGVVLDLEALLNELENLTLAGISTTGQLGISANCALVLPHHVMVDKAREQYAHGKGTTLRGIGPAHEDKTGRRAVRLGDVLADSFQDKLHHSVAHANCELKHLHGLPEADPDEIASSLAKLAAQAKHLVVDVKECLVQAQQAGEMILLEGSQGALLDIEQGSYPYVTSASCTAAASVSGLGIDLQPVVIGIAKAYATRVGRGSFPTEITGPVADLLTQQGKEYGATTARLRRVGWLDIPALRHALSLNGCQTIALTKLDILGLVDTIKICVNYRHHGKLLNTWPAHDDVLAECEPEYIECTGWGPLADINEIEDLPKACRDYVRMIESLCEVDVAVLSYGKDRNATLINTQESLAA